MKIAIASDHAGLELKAALIDLLLEKKHEIDDLGPNSNDSVDYPDFAKKVSLGIQEKNYEHGILICGTGLGMSYTANKFKGIRAALCTNEFMAEMAREHNDANVLVLGARVVGLDLAKNIVRSYFNSKFSEEPRHQNRINKIES